MDRDIADRVLARIAEGSSLRKASQAEGVAPMTVLDNVRRDPELSVHYARARQAGLETRADKLMDTAWDETIEPARLRIIVDAQKWELSKLLPKVYGDKLDVTAEVNATYTKIERVIVGDTPAKNA